MEESSSKLQPETGGGMKEKTIKKGDNPHMLVVNCENKAMLCLSISALRDSQYVCGSCLLVHI